MPTEKIRRKREVEILKDRERFQFRLRTAIWANPTSDTEFRLACLICFQPDLTNRQVFNLAKISTEL